jgi:hypothetical protein
MADLIERLFPDADQAEAALMLGVLLLVSVGVWFGRKRLRVTIPVAGGVVLLAAIAIPSSLPARSYAHRAACINNLKTIEAAKANWAKTNNKQSDDIPAMVDLVGQDPRFQTELYCPSGGRYSIGPVGKKARCSWENRGHKLE